MDAGIVTGYVLSAVLLSFASALTYGFVLIFKRGRRDNEPQIVELNRQSKLLFFIWLAWFIFFLAMSFLKGGGAASGITVSGASANLLSFICGIFLYAIGAVFYLTVYYLVDRSISATILEKVEDSPSKKLKAEEIKKIYDVEKKYRTQLQGMLEGGFVILERGYYRNSLKGKMYARTAGTIKQFLKLGPGG